MPIEYYTPAQPAMIPTYIDAWGNPVLFYAIVAIVLLIWMRSYRLVKAL